MMALKPFDSGQRQSSPVVHTDKAFHVCPVRHPCFATEETSCIPKGEPLLCASLVLCAERLSYLFPPGWQTSGTQRIKDMAGCNSARSVVHLGANYWIQKSHPSREFVFILQSSDSKSGSLVRSCPQTRYAQLVSTEAPKPHMHPLTSSQSMRFHTRL
jgi:hypothetical protein